MIRDLPPPTLPDSLRSVLAGAGYGPPPTEEPVVPDPEFPAEALAADPPEPLLTETTDADLSPEPALDDADEADPEPGPDRLDPERAVEPEADPRTKPGGTVRPRGPVASFAVHAVVLLAFFDWPAITPVEMLQPIPVTMRVEQPQPEQGQDKAQPPPQPEGHLASEDFGDPNTKESGAGAPAPAETPTPQPAAPPPMPTVQPAPPKPSPERVAAAIPPPKPTPPARPQPKPATAPAAPPHPDETPNRAAHAARYPGPSATRDEYLAYLLTLTKQHFDLLPMTAIGDRHGETVVAILVEEDGTIARIAVAQSSGFPDLDRRVEQMVAAVGRFPPLPQWYQGPRIELNLRLRFPEALEE